MIIDCYAICWNEEVFLPYFLKHYGHFCRNIFVFDNESDDRSREICKAAGAKVLTWQTNGKQDNLSMIALKNWCWKTSDADYVVVCDIDEIIVGLDKLTPHPGRIVQCHGIQMVGQGEPFGQIRRAFPAATYDKCAVFSPKVQDINFNIGCHNCTPVGCTDTIAGVCELLHYSILSEDSFVARCNLYAARASATDIKYGWGWGYSAGDENLRMAYQKALAHAGNLPDNIRPSF